MAMSIDENKDRNESVGSEEVKKTLFSAIGELKSQVMRLDKAIFGGSSRKNEERQVKIPSVGDSITRARNRIEEMIGIVRVCADKAEGIGGS